MKTCPVPFFAVVAICWLPSSEYGKVSSVLQSRSTDLGLALHWSTWTRDDPSGWLGRKPDHLTLTTASVRSVAGSTTTLR
jgi:hypothetical protein